LAITAPLWRDSYRKFDLRGATIAASRNKRTESAAPPIGAQASPAARRWRPLAALGRARALTSLQHRNFRLLWLGHSLTSMAFWMDQVTRGWLIYELTNSALQLGLVRGIQALPILFLSPVAGSAADRLSRKKLIVASQLVDGLMYGALAILIFSHTIQPWHVYLSAFVMAVDQTFLQPARAAIIADAVPRRHLTNAIGLNSMIFNTARSTGPALCGILIARYGTGGAYAIQATFCALATLWTMQLGSAPASRTGVGRVGQEPLLRSIVEGWKFSWQSLEVRTGLAVVMLVALLIVPFTTLLPIFARDILLVGAAGQGLLLTAMGVGALGSAVTIACFGDRMTRGLFMLGGAALYGLCVAGFAASPWFQASIALMIVIGVTNVFCNALVQTVIQTYSPSEFRGRTMAIFQLSNVVMTAGSMFLGGLATVIGTQWAVGLMGLAGALAMLAIHLSLPTAWRIR
jgi:MFS family permease